MLLPLEDAVVAGQLDIVQWLCDAYLSDEQLLQRNQIRDLLQYAANGYSYPVYKYLLSRGLSSTESFLDGVFEVYREKPIALARCLRDYFSDHSSITTSSHPNHIESALVDNLPVEFIVLLYAKGDRFDDEKDEDDADQLLDAVVFKDDLFAFVTILSLGCLFEPSRAFSDVRYLSPFPGS